MRRQLVMLLGLIVSLSPAFAPAAPPIRFGATVSLSGKYAETSGMIRRGIELWEKQVNARGGILGRPVELVLRDDGSDPEAVERLYTQLIEDDGVDFVFSPYGTPLSLRASAVTEQHRMVLLCSSSSGLAIWDRGYRYVFGMYALADRFFIGQLDLMARHGKSTVTVIHEDSPFNNDVADGIEAWAPRFGVAVLARLPFAPETADLGPVLDRAVAAGADGLIVSAYSPECHALLRLMTERHWRPDVVSMTIAPTHPDFVELAGAIGEGVFTASQWEPDDRIPYEGARQFFQDFQAEYGTAPSYHGASAFAACRIIEQAIIASGGVDHEGIREYIKDLDTATVFGRFKVDRDGRQIGHSPFIVQWQDGRKEIVYPRRTRTAEPRMDLGWEPEP